MSKIKIFIAVLIIVIFGCSEPLYAKARTKNTRKHRERKTEAVRDQGHTVVPAAPRDIFDEKPFPRDAHGIRIPINPGDIPYTLGVDDVIMVNVRMHEDISGEYIVTPEGTIFINLLGEIKVLGMTKDEVARILQERLSEYIIDIEMTVSIVGYRSKHIYVLGEVLFPGRIPMKGNIMSLRDAVIEAGLPTNDAASWRATIIRPSEQKPYVKHVNVRRLLYGGQLKFDYYLQPDDVVYLPLSLPQTFNKFVTPFLTAGQTGEDIVDVIKYFNKQKLWLSE